MAISLDTIVSDYMFAGRAHCRRADLLRRRLGLLLELGLHSRTDDQTTTRVKKNLETPEN